ncbi:MAG: dockerin type I repeat-containing protein, partial [Candidatus Zixiibacteriota bacterium]
NESLDQCCEQAKGVDEMEKATGWNFGNPVYDPGPICLGWATNLQDQYYDNNTCTLPLIGAIVAVPASQPVGGTRIYMKHWYRTADSNDRLFVTARERRPEASDVILTPSTNGLGFTGYDAGQGNNACGIGIPGFTVGEGRFVWSRFDIPTSFNGKKLSLKFTLGSDVSGNQGPAGSNTGWFFDKLIYIGTALHRGDADCNGGVDVGDLVYLINYLYRSGQTPCTQGNYGSAADVNCDGVVQIGDVVYLVNFLYRGGPPPPCPP